MRFIVAVLLAAATGAFAKPAGVPSDSLAEALSPDCGCGVSFFFITGQKGVSADYLVFLSTTNRLNVSWMRLTSSVTMLHVRVPTGTGSSPVLGIWLSSGALRIMAVSFQPTYHLFVVLVVLVG